MVIASFDARFGQIHPAWGPPRMLTDKVHVAALHQAIRPPLYLWDAPQWDVTVRAGTGDRTPDFTAQLRRHEEGQVVTDLGTIAYRRPDPHAPLDPKAAWGLMNAIDAFAYAYDRAEIRNFSRYG